ncbi:hypothetical protein C8J56DRAFT_1051158 [Mycena floridula]|nr:hypothetical protein C8J56DRAFT_1051158 [Mycena floridula]
MPKCQYCKHPFEDNRALHIHHSKCSTRDNGLSQIFTPRINVRNGTNPILMPELHNTALAEPEDNIVVDAISDEQEPQECLSCAAEAMDVEPVAQALPARHQRFAIWKYDDFQVSSLAALKRGTRKYNPDPDPEPESPAVPSPVNSPPSPSPAPSPCIIDITDVNEYGLFRVYEGGLPSRDPQQNLTSDDIADVPTFTAAETRQPQSPLRGFGKAAIASFDDSDPDPTDPETTVDSENVEIAPFLNRTVFMLMKWHYSKAKHSWKRLQDLVSNVLLHPDFKVSDLVGFSVKQEIKRMDTHIRTAGRKPLGDAIPDSADDPATFSAADGWAKESVSLKLPCAGIKTAEDEAPEFVIPNVWIRDPVEVIKAEFQDPSFLDHHLKAFKQFWKPSEDSNPQRIYGESYTSDRMLDMEDELRDIRQQQSATSNCTLETVVPCILIFSDSTHLANFGTAALWPIYWFFGNLSKYMRTRASSFAAHHMAYLPALPDLIIDFYKQTFGHVPTDEVLTFLKRELMQAIWSLLLDKKFMTAYKYGIVILCADNILRRIFPRFFCYSADYPEKVLLVGIKYLSEFLCPRCLVTKAQVPELGTKADMKRRVDKARTDTPLIRRAIEKARRLIFAVGYAVGGDAIDDILPFSITSTRNAFSAFFSELGHNYYRMFPTDILHDFEIGRWKDIFVHLIWILYAYSKESVTKLDERYCQIPTFSGAIQRFHNNVSKMKKFAARDWEDILQCVMPCFEGLLPAPHNKIVLDLLWDCSVYHAHAKLRLHTDGTVMTYCLATGWLGKSLRRWFTVTCKAFSTHETPRESNSRKHRSTKRKDKDHSEPTVIVDSKKKGFNMHTYKGHALRHGPDSIVQFGAGDATSTQPGEFTHKDGKLWYSMTNSMTNKQNAEKQIADHERRERLVHKVDMAINPKSLAPQKSESLPHTNSTERYHIALSQRDHSDIIEFQGLNKGDPAMKDFVVKLKNHLLARLYDSEDETAFTDLDRRKLTFVNNYIYKHSVVRLNYTTYDLRRAQDSVNPCTHPDIMMLSATASDDPHIYIYGHVIGVFHAKVFITEPGSRPNIKGERVDFLWVRWYEFDTTYKSGWKHKRLPRLHFLDCSDPNAFGFVDPANVLRGSHIIPAFVHGKTQEYLPADSVARQLQVISLDKFVVETDDWKYYYAGIFVDRDMFMRYRGGGIGHQGTLEYTLGFEEEAGVDFDALPKYDGNGDVITSADSDGGDDSDDPDVEMEETEPEESSGDEEEDDSDDSGDEIQIIELVDDESDDEDAD